MDKITVGSIEMTWDAEARLAFMHFESETHATGEDAVALVDTLTRWIGMDGKSFGLLGDGGSLAGIDVEYRLVWDRFFQQHREDSYIAFFNTSPLIRIAAEMFGLGTGLRLKAFAHEVEARSWLREKGIPA